MHDALPFLVNIFFGEPFSIDVSAQEEKNVRNYLAKTTRWFPQDKLSYVLNSLDWNPLRCAHQSFLLQTQPHLNL